MFVVAFDGDSITRWPRAWQCVLVLSIVLTGTPALFAATPAVEIASVDQGVKAGDEVRLYPSLGGQATTGPPQRESRRPPQTGRGNLEVRYGFIRDFNKRFPKV